MSAVITLKMLEEKKACEEQVDLFREHFGDSVDVTVDLALSVASVFDWEWAAKNLLDTPALEIYKTAIAPTQAACQAAKASAWGAYQAAKATVFAKAFLKQNGKAQ